MDLRTKTAVRLPMLATTGIGSLPHTQLEMAMQQSLQMDVPFLPTLPMADAAEFMLPQAIEGFPGARHDKDGNVTIAIAAWEKGKDAFTAKLDRAIEGTGNSAEGFLPRETCRAWSPFLWEIEARKLAHAKAQLTGPITLQWAVTLDDGRPVTAIAEIEKHIFRLVLARSLAMVRAIRARGASPIFFFDEPGLFAFDRRQPLHLLKMQELRILFLALQREGARVGVHCCSNTDWPSLLSAAPNLLSIDARLSLGAVLANGADLERWLGKGGTLALGIVPTNVASSYDLEGLVDAALAMLHAHAGGRMQVAQVLSQCLLTPACGLALRSVRDTEQTFEDLRAAQRKLRESARAASA